MDKNVQPQKNPCVLIFIPSGDDERLNTSEQAVMRLSSRLYTWVLRRAT